jgi:hypothetical protein
MSEKLSAVKRRVEAEIEKAKKFVGDFATGTHPVEKTPSPKHSCDGPRCSCKIPTPCWLPEDLGDLDVATEAGNSAQVIVRVRNTDGQQRSVTAQVTGTGAPHVTPTSASVLVPAYGWGTFTFNATVPAQTPPGTYAEVQIIINGCRRHILNWRVDVVEKCDPDEKPRHEMVVCDGADLIHHWYDHFYCRRQCHDVKGGAATP